MRVSKNNKDTSSASDSLDKSPVESGLLHDTIAALASGSQRAAISLLRISGPQSIELLSSCLPSMDWRKPRQMQLVSFIDPSSREVVDELMAVFFLSPKSFTGEDLVELNCHGSPYIIRRILNLLFDLGIRPAEPGEFTRRAFLNGKMDLTQAEGIHQLIESHSEHQWRSARQLADGSFAKYISDLRRSLVAAMAYLEASIDFPDEGDTQSIHLDILKNRVDEVYRKITRLISSYDNGRVARGGLRLTIVGAPNMGKSTLMNALLGRERAIVTEVAGTTRDYLEETCLIEGRSVCLIDTAGLRETDDKVERLGVERSLELARFSDLSIIVIAADATEEQKQETLSFLEELGSHKAILAVSKVDLGVPHWIGDEIKISCHEQNGLEALKQKIVSFIDDRMDSLGSDPYVTSERQVYLLSQSRGYLDQFFEALAQSKYEELLAFELQRAAQSLVDILGRIDSEDILDQVFGEFCVGK